MLMFLLSCFFLYVSVHFLRHHAFLSLPSRDTPQHIPSGTTTWWGLALVFFMLNSGPASDVSRLLGALVSMAAYYSFVMMVFKHLTDYVTLDQESMVFHCYGMSSHIGYDEIVEVESQPWVSRAFKIVKIKIRKGETQQSLSIGPLSASDESTLKYWLQNCRDEGGHRD